MYCYGCGYTLMALAEPRCPECGRPFDPRTPSTFASSRSSFQVRRAVRLLLRAAVPVLVVGIAYVGCYYAFVRLEGPGGGTGAPPWRRHAVYPVLPTASAVVFAPMEAIDQRVRPRAWEYWGVADACASAYEHLIQMLGEELPEALQADFDRALVAVDGTWFLDDQVEDARRALESGRGTQADLDAAIAERDLKVRVCPRGVRALSEEER